MMWLNNLQPGSYKGIAFDVVTLDDSNEKALAEHARPFVNGMDLEDMGTLGHITRMTAVYYGLGFDRKMIGLKEALEEQGPGVLVHPVFGRMQNMIAHSWSMRIEADFVNHVALDITFREATEGQQIFVFENVWLSRLEKLLNTLSNLTDTIMFYVDLILTIKNGVSSIFGSALGIFAAAKGIVGALRKTFDFDTVKYPDVGNYSSGGFSGAMQTQAAQIVTMLNEGLRNEAKQGQFILDARLRFDAVVNRVDEIVLLPDLIQQQSTDGSVTATQAQKITPLQMRPIAEFTVLSCVTVLASIAVELIEEEVETITAPELMHINNEVRKRIQAQIVALRDTYDLVASDKTTAKATEIYASTQQSIEALRAAAHELNLLVLAVINQKPPMRVVQAEIDGTVHQLAHHFYKDVTRSNELMRLNPHITHPSFISQGDWINHYAR